MVEIVSLLSESISTRFALILRSIFDLVKMVEVVEMFTILAIQGKYCALLLRHNLELSFCQVDNFAIALIMNFSFQDTLLFFLN